MAAKSSDRWSRRILVFQIGSLGDTVVTLPALRTVRNHYGQSAEIILLHNSGSERLVSPVSLLAGGPYVDGFLGYPSEIGSIEKIWSLMRLWRLLKRDRFHAVIYLLPSERPALAVRRDDIFFWSCGISERIGFHAFSSDFLYPKFLDGRLRRVTHEALRRLERLQMDGIDVSSQQNILPPLLQLPPVEIEAAKAWLAERRQYPERPLIAICPGAKQPANFWPLERFMEVGQRLVEDDKVELIIVGGPKENSLGQRLVQCWRSGINTAGFSSVIGSAALLSLCSFMLGLDTGTTHLAAAVGTRCVALYGCREHPGQWDPLGDKHIVLRSQVPCAGCRLRICPIEGHPCMAGITVEDVWRALQQIQQQ